LTELSRREIRGLFDHDAVTVNGRIISSGHVRLREGDSVEVTYDPHRRYHPIKPAPRGGAGFRRVFEDGHLIVVDKAAGILSVPTLRGEQNTLVDLIARHLARGRPRRPIAVHRLDRETSGLLVFAKDRGVAEILMEQFRRHEPERIYIAVVAGDLVPDERRLESFLATNRSLTRYSTRDPGKGERAVTRYRVQARRHGATLLHVWLETGRRNQIRVHLAQEGHPVLGDRRYRPDLARHPLWPHKRLALHAAVLALRHPITGKPMRWESRAPGAFAPFLGKERR
jgi:23S rRNA pseudouridine1911/1915/1917 synthase